ncbi:MAG: leucine-rich repeat protein, partial [Dysgonamonadaceae bacterium]|nr:leucine-rich repeat protein [Dysgonamonadaceae bacterium]
MKSTAILNRFKRIFNSHFLNSYLLLAVCLFGFSRVQAQTKQPLGGGAWGEKGNLFTWSLSSDSVLTIEGSGPMPLDSTILNNPKPPEYYYVDQLIPWYERFSAIKTVVINKDITSICMYAFYGCNNLVSITIPNSVNSIGRFAFSDCNRLPSIVIPEKVASIGTQAFRRCYNLTSIFVRNPTPPTVGALAFEFVPNTAKLYIINGQDSISSKEAYKKAPFWERFSANITAFVAKLHITLSSPDVWLSSTGDTIRLSTGATGDTIRLTTGDTIRLSAELWPKDADSSTATRDDSILIWSSADSLIAVVSDSNLVTVAGDLQKYNVKEKDVYIKVETKSGKIADSCLVRVIKSNVAALSSLYVNKGALVPPFDPDNTEYTVVVANSVSDITVEAEAANHPKATVSANSTWSLKVGENVLTVRVTAENGDTRDYTVRVTRQPNNNAALRDLTISSGKLIPLIPEFHSMRTDYTAVVANSVSEIRVNAVATREGAAVSAADSTWSLKVGDNRLTVTVTAEDGGYTADYTVKVRRQSSDVALERNIIVIDSVSNDTTILAGSDNGFDYAGSVPNSVSTVRVVVK